MAKEYTRDELWNLYEKLPEGLQEMIFSGDTADSISSVCSKNNVPEELVPQVARKVGDVLMGLLLPDEFQNVLLKEVGLKKSAADGVAHGINRFVFYPAKTLLEDLHRAPGERATERVSIATPRHSENVPEQSPTEDVSPEEKPIEDKEDKDQYREPLA